jgi:putative ABC transport system substrate-binding protein
MNPTMRRTILRHTALLAAPGAMAVAVGARVFPASAQEKMRRVGMLSNGTSAPLWGQPLWRDGILQSLEKHGYRVGKNLVFIERYSDGDADRLPGLASEIAAANVDLAIAISDPAVRAMMGASQTLPVVMVAGGDPVASGVVASMARPGGRITGLAYQNYEGDVKRLQLLREAMPSSRKFARLGPPGTTPPAAARLLNEAALRLDIELILHPVASLTEIDYRVALNALRDAGVSAVLLAATQALAIDAPLIGRLAQTIGLPTMCEWDYMARHGCVLAYGHDLVYSHRRVGDYAARILAGERPADIAVEQPDAWKLTVNLRAADRAGLTLPHALVARADEVLD